MVKGRRGRPKVNAAVRQLTRLQQRVWDALPRDIEWAADEDVFDVLEALNIGGVDELDRLQAELAIFQYEYTAAASKRAQKIETLAERLISKLERTRS